MKKIILSVVLISMFFFNAVSQNSTISLKLIYPECSIKNESFIKESKGVKSIVIKSQEEFDKYFKITDDYKINFENSMALVGFVGEENYSKYININGTTYNARKSILYIKQDLKEKPAGTCGKYCVVFVKKMEYKKVYFLNGKKYNRNQRRKDLFLG